MKKNFKKKPASKFSIRTFLIALVGVYFLGVTLISLYGVPSKTSRELPQEFKATKTKKNSGLTVSFETPQNITHRFDNPKLAFEVLNQLDVFKPVDESYFIARDGASVKKYDKPYLGLTNDPQYCRKRREYFVNHPENVFQGKVHILMEASHASHLRKVILPMVGKDVQPYIGFHLPQEVRDDRVYDVDPAVNLFFTIQALHLYKQIGEHFSCLSQVSNHIPGHIGATRKDFVAENAIAYAKRYVGREHCFNNDKFFPKTYILYQENDCKEFFSIINSPEYKQLKKEKNIVYIRKVGTGSHKGEGVQPVDDEEEAALRTRYGNGALCGTVWKNYIVQHFVDKPMLIEGRKFDFRSFIFIASTNPLTVYYHDGVLRVSLMPYELETGDKKTLLTNIALNKEIYAELKSGGLYKGMDEDAVKHAQQWSFERFFNYLLSKGIVKDPNWMDNYLRPEFKKAMIHFIRLAQHRFFQHHSVYGLWGIDFMLDEEMNLWFIEANAGPSLNGGYSIDAEGFYIKMLVDHFEIVMGLLRSRMKRVVFYVNNIIKEGQVVQNKDGFVTIKNLEGKRREFEKLLRGYFEKEYEPSPSNGFSKIIDEKYEGVDRYMGYLTEDCL